MIARQNLIKLWENAKPLTVLYAPFWQTNLMQCEMNIWDHITIPAEVTVACIQPMPPMTDSEHSRMNTFAIS
jgi:hypothetical protein